MLREESSNEILQFAIENGMLDEASLLDKIEMDKRKQLLTKHKFKIWQGTNGKWYTYIEDHDKKTNRKLVKRSSRSDIESVAIEEVKRRTVDKITFKSWYDRWVDRQMKCGRSSNTIHKYKVDYIRMFQGEDIEDMDIRDITSTYLEDFFYRRIIELKLPKQATKGIFGYVNGMYKKAIIDRVVNENPCKYVDIEYMLVNCSNERKRRMSQRIFNEDEMKAFVSVLDKHIEKDTDYIQNYGVKLAIYTGMRVGEIAALKWDNVFLDERYIIVCSEEIFEQETHRMYIADHTKNGKTRTVPITDNAYDVLREVRKSQMRNGWLSDYVFANENGRIRAKAISECVRRRCRTAKIPEKSIHSLRRTLNSKMRCNGVPVTIASSILGHSEKVNELNYTYDITSTEYKLEVMNSVV